MHNAPKIPKAQWFAMTRLDQNRAATQLAKKAGVEVAQVKSVGIWGNHSSTQFPDFYHATINGRPAPEAIHDEAWLKGPFVDGVQKRGAAVIKARGASSAASAANAVVDTVKSLITPTQSGDCISTAVCSDGSYGVDAGLIFGYPLTTDGKTWKISQGLSHSEFARQKIDATLAELRSERDTIKVLLPG
jgi:malate dehydrogenase